MTKKKGRTAEEIEAELAQDTEYQERIKQRDEAIRRAAEVSAKAERLLVKELCDAGTHVSSVWDLVQTKRRYPELIPVLVKHLDLDYPEEIRDGIARALAVKEARPAWEKLVNAYLREDASNTKSQQEVNQVKWALHLALAAAADESCVEDLIKLAADRRHGPHRSLFIDKLASLRDPRAIAAVEELRGDPDLLEDYKLLDKRRAKRKR